MLFTTTHDNQTEALIVVYEEGDDEKQQLLLGYFKVVGIPLTAKGVPEINVCMDIDASNMLRVIAGVVMPGSGTKNPVVPLMEVRMPMADDGHGLCADALYRSSGSTLDLKPKMEGLGGIGVIGENFEGSIGRVAGQVEVIILKVHLVMNKTYLLDRLPVLAADTRNIIGILLTKFKNLKRNLLTFFLLILSFSRVV
ncbi:putative Heat shock protein 70 family [Helianthus annuus]|nr:putative Heat shock protein 70 family [Helianthus annuus]